MNNYLRNLSPTHQVAALFVIVFGLLFIVSTVAFLLSFRERRNPVHDEIWQRELQHFGALLHTTWFMVVVFWLLMSDSFTLGQFVLGMILGVVVPLFAARLDREFARIGSLRPLPKLLFVTLWDILISNIRVAIQVLGPERRIHPGFGQARCPSCSQGRNSGSGTPRRPGSPSGRSPSRQQPVCHVAGHAPRPWWRWRSSAASGQQPVRTVAGHAPR